MTVTVLSDRQLRLLVACVRAELDNSARCDTSLSLVEIEGKEDVDKALAGLRRELQDILDRLPKTAD